MSLLDDIETDDILGLRDSLGLALKAVFLVTRTWDGSEPGDGDYEDEEEQILPSPRVVEFKHDLRVRQGGAVQDGDILLKMISKESYDYEQLDGSTDQQNVEKLYKVGADYCTPISVEEKHLTWTVLCRKVTK